MFASEILNSVVNFRCSLGKHEKTKREQGDTATLLCAGNGRFRNFSNLVVPRRACPEKKRGEKEEEREKEEVLRNSIPRSVCEGVSKVPQSGGSNKFS